jgi:hypothetical protein
MLIDFEGVGRCWGPFEDFLLFGETLMKVRSFDGEFLLLVPIAILFLNLRHTFRLMMKRMLEEEGYCECFLVNKTRFVSHSSH